MLEDLCRLPVRKLTTVRVTDSQSCILAQEGEQHLQNGDPQLTGHVLQCLFLISGLSAISIVGCSGSSTMRLDNSVELQFYPAASNFGQRFISFGSFGLDKHLKTPRAPAHHHTEWAGRRYPDTLANSWSASSTNHYCVQAWGGEMGERGAEELEHYKDGQI